jgi:hypothetical protein
MNIYPAQYGSAVSVTPSDTTIISCRGIYIATGAPATLVLNSAATGGTSVNFLNAQTATLYPFELNQGRIMNTGSGVGNVVALS